MLKIGILVTVSKKMEVRSAKTINIGTKIREPVPPAQGMDWVTKRVVARHITRGATAVKNDVKNRQKRRRMSLNLVIIDDASLTDQSQSRTEAA